MEIAQAVFFTCWMSLYQTAAKFAILETSSAEYLGKHGPGNTSVSCSLSDLTMWRPRGEKSLSTGRKHQAGMHKLH